MKVFQCTCCSYEHMDGCMRIVTTEFALDIRRYVSRGSSVSIVSGYGLDYRAIEVRPRQRRKDFSCSLCVQTGSETHPASCGYRGSFPRGEARPERDADHSPHLLPRSRMSRSYTSSSPKRLRGL
jgi:hypothetical protein